MSEKFVNQMAFGDSDLIDVNSWFEGNPNGARIYTDW